VDAKRAKVVGRRIIISAFITLATVFIGLSAIQIIPAALGVSRDDGPIFGKAAPLSAACVSGVSRLNAALDRGAASVVTNSAAKEDEASAAFRASLSPEWDGAAAVESACASEPRGRDAYAALVRLREAREHAARRDAVEIAPLRRDVAAYLGP
jgi:hypothetical protein